MTYHMTPEEQETVRQLEHELSPTGDGWIDEKTDFNRELAAERLERLVSIPRQVWGN